MMSREDALAHLSDEMKRDLPGLIRGIPEEGIAIALAALDKKSSEWTMDEATTIYTFALWMLGESEGKTIKVIANIAAAAIRNGHSSTEEEAISRGTMIVANMSSAATYAIHEALVRMNELHPDAFHVDRTDWPQTMRSVLESRAMALAANKARAGERKS